jgi:hypothetical protein
MPPLRSSCSRNQRIAAAALDASTREWLVRVRQICSGRPRPFVLRVRFLDGAVVPPHCHSQDEHVTVLEGVFRLGMGAIRDDAAATPVKTGSFSPRRHGCRTRKMG